MTLTQILQKIRNAFYTKKEIDSMGGGVSLSDTISQKANKSDLANYLPLTGGQMTNGITFKNTAGSSEWLGGFQYFRDDSRCGYVLGYVGENETRVQIQCDDAVNIDSKAFYFNGKQVAVAGDYLPISGGTMNATIKTHTSLGGPAIQHISPSDGTPGGELWLFNAKTDYHGGAILRCRSEDGVSFKDFLVKADGVCKWDNRAIDTIEEQGDNYIRYSNGIQICWGLVSEGMTVTTNFPKSFSQIPSISITSNTQNTDSTLTANCTNQAVTVYNKFEYYSSFYTAIGKWK